ncbi:MAG TPA: helical backbone metal receptor [Terriglobales bacterium]|nr:helical backbone metal receptor [Terriglobales bacterium]
MTRAFFYVATCLALAAQAPAQAPPQRIISLAPSVTETVFALGMGDRLVGVSVYCDYPPEVTKLDKVGTFLTPNVEAILTKRPDLVLVVPSPGNHSPVEELQRLGLRVVVVDPGSLAEIKHSFATIGSALGREAAAGELAVRLDRQIESVTARLAAAPLRKVLMVVGQTPLIAAGRDTVQDELITLARGINVAARAGSGWPHLSIELAISAAPEVIIDSTMGNEVRVGAGAAESFWNQFATIPAVRHRRVVGFRAYEVLRPGPRIGDALERIAHFIHPERIP